MVLLRRLTFANIGILTSKHIFLITDHKCKGELCLKIGNITAKIDRSSLNVFLLCCQIILRNLLKTNILFQITRFCVFAQL